MTGQIEDPVDHFLPDRAFQPAVVEEGDVLRPGEADHYAQPVPRGFVQQVESRRRVGADRVDAEIRHQAEVFGDAGARRKLITVGIGRKGAVGDAFDEEAVVAGAQELPVGRQALGRGKIQFWKFDGVSANGRAHNRE